MATKSSTVAHQTQVIIGATIFRSIVVTTKPNPVSASSVHDCATPGAAGLHNMIWPINMVAPPAADGSVACANGIYIHSAAPGGSVTIVSG